VNCVSRFQAAGFKFPIGAWLVFLSLLGPGAARAFLFQQADNFIIPAETVIKEQTALVALSGAGDISFRGIFRNDAFLAAQTIQFKGTAENDVWAMADTLAFTGEIRDNARFLARRATELNGRIGKDLAVAANAVMLGDQAVVAGDALLAGDTVTVSGRIGGQLRIHAIRATLDGHVGGNLRITADDIVIMPGAMIDGDLVYTCPKELFLNEKVQLKGQLIRHTPAASGPARKSGWRQQISSIMYFYLAALITGLPFVGLFPRFAGRSVRLIRRSVWKCALAGIVAFCIVPLLSLLAMVTLVGLPLGFLLALAYIILLYLGKIATALALGAVMFRRQGPQTFARVFTALSLGLIALYLGMAAPLIGALVWLAAAFIGLGALILALAQPDVPVIELPNLPPLPNDTPPVPFTTDTKGGNP